MLEQSAAHILVGSDFLWSKLSVSQEMLTEAVEHFQPWQIQLDLIQIQRGGYGRFACNGANLILIRGEGGYLERWLRFIGCGRCRRSLCHRYL